jgi:tetratricopeptide (TPR) repeat protein
VAQKDLGQALGLAFQRVAQHLSASHPKTGERMEDVAAYLDRHYAEGALPEPNVARWKSLAGRDEVAQVMRNYDVAFTARKMLEKQKIKEAYAFAKAAAAGRTATDAYPNWVLAKSAAALGRQKEAIDALRRAIASNEPIPQIYEEVILAYEQAGSFAAALEWADKASAAFGESPRWMPTKIRLLRKAGRAKEAEALALKCAVESPEWRRYCQESNKT